MARNTKMLSGPQIAARLVSAVVLILIILAVVALVRKANSPEGRPEITEFDSEIKPQEHTRPNIEVAFDTSASMKGFAGKGFAGDAFADYLQGMLNDTGIYNAKELTFSKVGAKGLEKLDWNQDLRAEQLSAAISKRARAQGNWNGADGNLINAVGKASLEKNAFILITDGIPTFNKNTNSNALGVALARRIIDDNITVGVVQHWLPYDGEYFSENRSQSGNHQPKSIKNQGTCKLNGPSYLCVEKNSYKSIFLFVMSKDMAQVQEWINRIADWRGKYGLKQQGPKTLLLPANFDSVINAIYLQRKFGTDNSSQGGKTKRCLSTGELFFEQKSGEPIKYVEGKLELPPYYFAKPNNREIIELSIKTGEKSGATSKNTDDCKNTTISKDILADAISLKKEVALEVWKEKKWSRIDANGSEKGSGKATLAGEKNITFEIGNDPAWKTYKVSLMQGRPEKWDTLINAIHTNNDTEEGLYTSSEECKKLLGKDMSGEKQCMKTYDIGEFINGLFSVKDGKRAAIGTIYLSIYH